MRGILRSDNRSLLVTLSARNARSYGDIGMLRSGRNSRAIEAVDKGRADRPSNGLITHFKTQSTQDSVLSLADGCRFHAEVGRNFRRCVALDRRSPKGMPIFKLGPDRLQNAMQHAADRVN